MGREEVGNGQGIVSVCVLEMLNCVLDVPTSLVQAA